jgi:hypothetical protein
MNVMDEQRKAALKKSILVFLESVPLHLKEGPWSPMAHFVLISIFGFILLSFEHAALEYAQLFDESSASHASRVVDVGASVDSWIQNYRLFGGLYGLTIVSFVIFESGLWPLASYTLTSWNLMTLRLLTSYIGAAGWKDISPTFQLISDVVRFPALVGCSITVIVWWLALVPVIHVLSGSEENRARFWKFNLSFPLLNLHAANLPLCAIEFIASGKCLTFFDLWTSMAIAFVYVLFYLNVLDAQGLHFYIIFTPRTFWCFLPYGLILLIYFGAFQAWNHVLASTYSLATC